MIDFLIKSTLALALLYVVYILLLEREKMHHFNRFYLLFSLLFSVVIPFITFEIYVESTVVANEVIVQDMLLPTAILYEKTDYVAIILLSVYLIITTILMLRFVSNLMKIKRKIYSNPSEQLQNATLILLNEKVLPHTFLNFIFINKDDFDNRKIEEELYTHEQTHVNQKHTLDILLIELMLTIFWFNPILILYKKTIQLNHEFLADENVVQSYNNVPFYQNLLLEKASWNNTFYLASNLNYLVTKKRLIMMTKTTSQSRALLKKLTLVPILTGMIFISCSEFETKVSSEKTEVYLNGVEVAHAEMDKPISELVKTKKFANKRAVATTAEIEKIRSSEKIGAITSTSIEVMELDHESAHTKPTFPGGIQKFYEFVAQNFLVPDVKDLNGRIIIQFVIEKDGSLTEIKSMRDIGHGTGDEAVRVLQLSPKWIPGEENGEPVRVLYSLPISIKGAE
jgi:beta-lactamase regulating signal transducer with metallopeptidase domain